MRRKLSVLLVCALLPAGALAGCGGGGSKKQGPVSGLSLAQARARNRVSKEQTYKNCLRALNNAPVEQKQLLQQQCSDIQTGNERDLHVVDRELCQVEAQAQPEPERTTLLAQCKTL